MSGVDRMFLEARREAARAWLLQENGPCRVKLCGMFRDQDIDAVNACLPDMMGFITSFPKSHRNVEPPELKRLAQMVDERVYRVGVSVNLPFGRVAHNANNHVDIVQLHGDEDDLYLQGVRMRTRAGIIQAFRIRSTADVEKALSSTADMVLLDAGTGSGTQFDWSLIDGFCERRPFMLAGGLTPDNVSEAISALHPWGVDLSSGIETNKVKDPAKMAATVAAVRSAS
ncbi:MAG: phosphoribosylanthranilate isomerase [Atopobiaceae bacterium]|nr:phosphoribosylanthranilate isomerase [Atopobiaceae bacterium]